MCSSDLEHYFGIRSYVALAGFYKDFQSAIVTKDVVFDFAGYTNPSGVVPVSDLGTLDTPTNVRGGWVRGVELSGTLDLASFADWLDGFGIMGNWAHSASSLPGTDAGGHPSPDTTLDGLSEDVVNFVEYYEKNGYSFRIGQRYRSGFSALRHNAFRFVMDTIRPEMVEIGRAHV